MNAPTQTSSSSSILKKKGPGMPPPPMVPGKHNLDIGTWDSPKNGPALVPPPPLPIVIQPPINTDEVSPLSNAHPLNNPPKQQQLHHHQNHHHNSLNRNAPSPPMHGDRRSNDAGPMGPGGPGDFRTAMHRSTNNDNNGAYNNRNNGGPPSRPAWSGNTNNRGGPPMAGSQESRGGGMLPSFQRSNINARGASPPPPNNYRDAQQQHVNNQHSAAPVPLARGPSIPNAERSTQPIQVAQSQQQHSGYNQSGGGGGSTIAHSPPGPVAHNRSNKPIADFGGSNASLDNPAPVAVGLDELRVKNQYNPQDFDFDTCVCARFFVIKSYSEDDIHRSIKYEIWCSTDHGNRRLDQAFHEREKVNGVIYLLFSVNGSGHFCGVAQMLTAVDYNTVSSVWSQSKWKGSFKVKWIYVKDVPNTHMRHIRLENNENKPVTNSRDAQEVPNVQGIEVLRIISAFKHVTSIFDDFVHYEKRQQEEVDTKKMDPYGGGKYGGGSDGGSYDRGGSYGGGYERNKGYGGEWVWRVVYSSGFIAFTLTVGNRSSPKQVNKADTATVAAAEVVATTAVAIAVDTTIVAEATTIITAEAATAVDTNDRTATTTLRPTAAATVLIARAAAAVEASLIATNHSRAWISVTVVTMAAIVDL